MYCSWRCVGCDKKMVAISTIQLCSDLPYCFIEKIQRNGFKILFKIHKTYLYYFRSIFKFHFVQKYGNVKFIPRFVIFFPFVNLKGGFVISQWIIINSFICILIKDCSFWSLPIFVVSLTIRSKVLLSFN